MAVALLLLAPVLEPLLQVALLPDLHRGQPAAGRQGRVPQLPVDTQHLGRLGVGAEQVVEDLHVDGRARADAGPGAEARGDLVEVGLVAGPVGEVLGRGGGVRDQPAVPGVLDEEVEEELDRSLEDRIDLLQVLLVSGEEVVLPQVGGEPGPAGGERPPGRAVHGRGDPPEVGVLVVHPPPRAVVLSGHVRALVGQLSHQSRQGLGELAQVADLRRPVVHLGVDVRRVLRVPRGVHVLVPDALEVGGLGAGPRGRDQQVAPELEAQGGQVGIAPDPVLPRASRRWAGRSWGRSRGRSTRAGSTAGGRPRARRGPPRRTCPPARPARPRPAARGRR